ncbi:hypothetical protein Tsubulata_046447 [Turnera subulata]|uniref:Association with the SNF1 complex (ASC) domain-containing protein n=1 Tax=Turnera subulata TaxID=218843 RepID=A0A9Q0F8Q9_9ROSI|nr:hypothetical protein Tsubulata_046447 [Turnera subulata]
MGNASGKSDGEGTSGARYGEEGYEQVGQGMEFAGGPHGGAAPVDYHAQGVYGEAEPMMLHSPPHSPRGYLQLQPPLYFTPQVPIVPLQRPGDIIHTQNYGLMPYTTESRDTLPGKPKAVMIAWNYEGKKVAVAGSWDNWGKREPLQRSGKDFIIMKMLPSGVYHYRFIVDENVRHAPDLPWEYDDRGNAYNILDVPEYDPEAGKSLSEFELPPSPESSYNNGSLSDNDFSKPPPDMPPQLPLMLLNDRASAAGGNQSMTRPQHTVLNHLYIQNNRGQPVALGCTHRFRQKYVTVVLYKPSRR